MMNVAIMTALSSYIKHSILKEDDVQEVFNGVINILRSIYYLV